jgi:DNA-binding NtrC family response regulator
MYESLECPLDPQILVISDKNRLTEEVESALFSEGLSTRCATSLREGCKLVATGQFQVVVTARSLFDGTWERLAEMADRYHRRFVIIVVATKLDDGLRSAALEEGVFEVLNASSDLPRLGEAARSALWAAYLEGARPTLERQSLRPEPARR